MIGHHHNPLEEKYLSKTNQNQDKHPIRKYNLYLKKNIYRYTKSIKFLNILNLFPLLSTAAAAIKFANVGFVEVDGAVLLFTFDDNDDDITVFCFK
jgi:hypothetical protein